MNAFENSPEGRDWLVDMLKQNIVTVTFSKRNGEERVMQCTLQPRMIRESLGDKYKEEFVSTASGNACTVWDINARGWRSFIWSNIKQIHFTL